MPNKHKLKPSGQSKLKSQWDIIRCAIVLLRLKKNKKTDNPNINEDE